jgi:TatA/E family protein of Tat protein translocase
VGIENPVHLLFLAAIALIVLGPKRLPALAKALGEGIREFRTSLTEGALHEHPAEHPPAAVQAPPPAAAQPASLVQASAAVGAPPAAAQPPGGAAQPASLVQTSAEPAAPEHAGDVVTPAQIGHSAGDGRGEH